MKSLLVARPGGPMCGLRARPFLRSMHALVCADAMSLRSPCTSFPFCGTLARAFVCAWAFETPGLARPPLLRGAFYPAPTR